MAQWKETLEPYVKVIESVKTAPLNPTAGEDLIIGAVVISDAGPNVPTLINSQSSFISTFGSQALTQAYTNSLNQYYEPDPSSPLASTMWLNAFRLSGSANLLVSRAIKKGSGIFVKSLDKNDNNDYILKDSEILKKIDNGFRLAIDTNHEDGWAIAINEVGVFGCLVSNEGPKYDYFVNNLPDLVDKLNETSKFFSPDFTFYKMAKDGTNDERYVEMFEEIDDFNKYDVKAVVFNEVYLAPMFLDTTWMSGNEQEDEERDCDEPGYAYLVPTDRWGRTSVRVLEPVVHPAESDGSVDKEHLVECEDENAIKNDATTKISGLTADDLEAAQTEMTKWVYVIKKYDYYTASLDEDGEWSINIIPENGAEGDHIIDWESSETPNSENFSLYVTENDPDILAATIRITNNNYYTVEVKESEDNINDAASVILDGDLVASTIIDLNDVNYSNFESPQWYALNVNNSNSNIKVRIRRFNHDAVTSKITTDSKESPWIPIKAVIEAIAKNGYLKSNTYHDFYEFAIYDPGISSDWMLFNVGNLSGRGDITISELKSSLSMLGLCLPEDLSMLNLNYWDGNDVYDHFDDFKWVEIDSEQIGENSTSVGETYNSLAHLYSLTLKQPINMTASLKQAWSDGVKELLKSDKYAIVNSGNEAHYYQLVNNGFEEVEKTLSIPVTSKILSVTDTDIMRAWDAIEQDERYIVEGVTDLGNTNSIIQNYIANMAVNSNYFYPISCAFSGNYLTIAKKATKITANSNKIWFGGSYDLDDGTVGYLFNFGSSALYWETVARNKRSNNEFAGVFGQNTGVASIVNLNKEYTKNERQLLLGAQKKINTITHDLYLERYYWNDNWTGQTDNNILSEECNTRLQIRISKVMPILLNQFKGRQNTSRLWAEVEDVVNYWFKTVVLAYNYSINDYRVLCSSIMTDELVRANKLNIKVQVRYNNSVKYITVFNEAYSVGIEFED